MKYFLRKVSPVLIPSVPILVLNNENRRTDDPNITSARADIDAYESTYASSLQLENVVASRDLVVHAVEDKAQIGEIGDSVAF